MPRLIRAAVGGWKGVAAILGAVASAISVYVFAEGRGAVPVHPSPMTGDLNIAVADFAVSHARDQTSARATAHALAQSVYDYLDPHLWELRRGNLDIQTRSASAVAVHGDSATQRSEDLGRAASQLRADLIVSATLKFNGGETTVVPELYLGTNKLEDALELAGYHALTPLTIEGDPDSNPVIRQDLRSSLIERSRGIARFIVGLGYYEDKSRQDHLIKAEVNFSLALHDWTDANGQKLLYVFLGNVAGKRGQLAAAQQYYTRALRIEPAYDRAQLGRAEVLFQRAQGSCRAASANIASLWSALDAYRKLLATSGNTTVEGLSSKAALGAGRSYLCLSEAGAADRWAQARAQFHIVIESYARKHGSVLRELAAEGYAGLALTDIALEGPDKGYREAASHYRLAIEYSRDPDRRGFFFSALGETYMKLHNPERACAAYHQAELADPAHLPDYRKDRRSVPGCL
jgi:tetratricopeptide (TPR) repeat protein